MRPVPPLLRTARLALLAMSEEERSLLVGDVKMLLDELGVQVVKTRNSDLNLGMSGSSCATIAMMALVGLGPQP